MLIGCEATGEKLKSSRRLVQQSPLPTLHEITIVVRKEKLHLPDLINAAR